MRLGSKGGWRTKEVREEQRRSEGKGGWRGAKEVGDE